MPSYKKLPGRSGQSRLWLGEDHLLLVTKSGYHESYRRLYFSDIQAIIVRKSAQRMIINIICGSCALLFVPLAFIGPLRLLVTVALVLVCLAVVINSLLGSTCKCSIQTMTARHPIPPLERTRYVLKTLSEILPLIAASQGHLPPEKLDELFNPSSVTEAPPVIGS